MTTSAVRLAAPPDLGQPETDEDLLISKITPPPPPAWLVPRRRIGTLISAGTRGPLTVISGPPGAGKTTAIASWAAGQQAATPVAWLSVDSYDNRPGSFWRYVTEAIRRAGVAVRPGDPAHAQDGTAGHLLLRLASTLAARSAPVVLVLDDIHLLTNRRQLSDLSYLLRNTAGGLDCEQEQFLPDGTFVPKWQLHWVSGWSPDYGEYRAVMTDNYGHAEVFRGRIDGDRLVLQSLEGAAAQLRFTWDASHPAVINWRNEMATGDGSWFLIEEYAMVPQ